MPTREHYLRLAKDIKAELDQSKLAFKSYPRAEMTDRVRTISGEPATRIKQAGVGTAIEDVFRDLPSEAFWSVVQAEGRSNRPNFPKGKR